MPSPSLVLKSRIGNGEGATMEYETLEEDDLGNFSSGRNCINFCGNDVGNNYQVFTVDSSNSRKAENEIEKVRARGICVLVPMSHMRRWKVVIY